MVQGSVSSGRSRAETSLERSFCSCGFGQLLKFLKPGDRPMVKNSNRKDFLVLINRKSGTMEAPSRDQQPSQEPLSPKL